MGTTEKEMAHSYFSKTVIRKYCGACHAQKVPICEKIFGKENHRKKEVV